jgi:ElaB/YqjD/DUF883 family membrane-anchored ribosome-binding protein
MATITGPIAAAEAVKDRFAPVLEGLEENIREAKRVILHRRHTAEDFVAETVLKVRRHPLQALVFAASVGALAGCLCGFVLGRRRTASEKAHPLTSRLSNCL